MTNNEIIKEKGYEEELRLNAFYVEYASSLGGDVKNCITIPAHIYKKEGLKLLLAHPEGKFNVSLEEISNNEELSDASEHDVLGLYDKLKEGDELTIKGMSYGPVSQHYFLL